MTDENRAVRIPWSEVSQVYFSRSKGRHVWRSAIGAALVGGVIGGYERPTAGPGCVIDCYTRGENIAYTAIGFGMMGGLIGALRKTDRWVEVPLDRLR